MERERLKYVWGLDRHGSKFDYLAQNRDFWRVWGPKAVPECTCQPSVGVMVELKPTPHKNGYQNGAGKLHYGHVSAPVYSQLRSRLSVFLFRTTGNIEIVDMDLDSLAVMAGRGSRSVLQNLLKFEAGLHPS